MEVHANSNHASDSFLSDDRRRRTQTERAAWDVLGRLYRWRLFIIAVTGTVAVAAVVLSLLLPNWYQASARLLLPTSGGGSSLAASLLRSLPAASALLGGTSSGDFIRYQAILTSRSLMEEAVDTFDLIEVYELEESPRPQELAVSALRGNTSFEVDIEFEFLSVSVLDQDPERAAAIANFLVRGLNRINATLSSQSAAGYRRFVEQRYVEARRAVDSLFDASQRFQQEYGVFDLPAQTEAFLTQLANLRAGEIQAQVQYEALRDQLGPNNAHVQALRDVTRAAERQYRRALEGSEEVLPVAQDSVPGVVRQYAALELEQLIQTSILEVIGPMYEQARLDEEREVEAVQVVDYAVPPKRKAKPKRSVIVIAATLSAFLLSVLFVLLYTWWQRNHAYLAHRLHEAAAPDAAERGQAVRVDGDGAPADPPRRTSTRPSP